MRRHRGHIVALLVSVALLAGAGTTGYLMARSEPRLRAEAEATQAAVEANNQRISGAAVVRWEYEYEMCGHVDIVEGPADENTAGLTFSQLQQAYPDARIVTFETNRVVLRMSFPCYCPEHYMLKKNSDELAIFQTREGTGEQRVFRLIHLRFDSIDAGEQPVLLGGRVFDSVEDAEAYIEKLAQ